MSQRRGGNPKESVIAVKEEPIPFSECLDPQKEGMTMDRTVGVDVDLEDPQMVDPDAAAAVPLVSGSLSLDGREMRNNNNNDISTTMDWKEGYFASGSTQCHSWKDELQKFRDQPRKQCMKFDDRDSSPCLCCSAIVCGLLNMGRVGNIVVLKQSQEWVETEEVDENGNMKVHRSTRPRLDCVVGPYWPMLLIVTYPLILGVSIATMINGLPGKPWIIIFLWTCLTVSLITALALTAFRDPGILPRQLNAPNGSWRWTDRGHSYRPPGSWFDHDTGVIVEEFDHT